MSDNPLVNALKELCLFLDDAGIDYALAGGLAIGVWSHPRATVSMQFVVSIQKEDSHALAQRLNRSNRFIDIHDDFSTFQRVSFLRATLKADPELFVDFVFADDEFKAGILKRKHPVHLADFSVSIATPEDLAILSLLSGREQGRIDAEQIIVMQGAHLDRNYLQTWADWFGLTISGIS